MTTTEPCSQDGCVSTATWLMYWPGAPPKPVCEEHMTKALGIASAMGFYLQVETL